MADYEKCEYFEAVEDTLQSTVFDHPDYEYFCNKDGKHKRIIFPEGCCGRCLARQEDNIVFNLKELKWNELNDVIEDVLHIKETAIMRLYRMVKNGDLTRFRDYSGWGAAKHELYVKEDAKDLKLITDTVEAGYKENIYELLHNLLSAKTWEYLQDLIKDIRKQYYIDTTIFYIDLACRLRKETTIYKKPIRFSHLGLPIIHNSYGLSCVTPDNSCVYTTVLDIGCTDWKEMSKDDIDKHRAKAFGLFRDNIIDLDNVQDDLADIKASYDIMIDKIARGVLDRASKK